jgi:hypothetical protein
MEKIASYTGRSPASVARDLDRWSERGLEGLADGTAPGNPARITEEAKTFLREKLSEERTFNATQLAEALREEFGLMVTPEAVRQRRYARGGTPASAFDGLLVETHPLRAEQTAGPRERTRGQGGVGRAEKGAREGELVLKHLDESGFYLYMPPAHTWTKKGQQAHQHRVRSRWGSEGRVNLMGTLRLLEGEDRERLEYRMLEGSCDSGEVLWATWTPWRRKPDGRGSPAWWSWTTPRCTPPGSFGSTRRSGRRGDSRCTGCRPIVRT